MRRDDILRQLTAHKSEIAAFGVKQLSLFGSVARDEARPDSDIDLLVEFDPPVGLFTVVKFRMFLEKMLEHRVDLVLHDAVKPQIRERISKDLIHAAYGFSRTYRRYT